MQGGKAPTARQKRWQDWLRDQGCACCGMPAEIHHCVGSTGKHNKVWIGQDFCLPLCPRHHRHEASIDKNTAQFVLEYFGEPRDIGRRLMEKQIFAGLVAHYRRSRGELPCSAEVLAAIEDWRR